MTKEERKEAELLANDYDQSMTGIAGLAFVDGYAAACRSKNAKIKFMHSQWGISDEYLKAERERSAKLIEALQILKIAINDKENNPGATAFIGRTLAAYEASRD